MSAITVRKIGKSKVYRCHGCDKIVDFVYRNNCNKCWNEYHSVLVINDLKNKKRIRIPAIHTTGVFEWNDMEWKNEFSKEDDEANEKIYDKYRPQYKMGDCMKCDPELGQFCDAHVKFKDDY